VPEFFGLVPEQLSLPTDKFALKLGHFMRVFPADGIDQQALLIRERFDFAEKLLRMRTPFDALVFSRWRGSRSWRFHYYDSNSGRHNRRVVRDMVLVAQ
jgi:hypothetical protein